MKREATNWDNVTEIQKRELNHTVWRLFRVPYSYSISAFIKITSKTFPQKAIFYLVQRMRDFILRNYKRFINSNIYTLWTKILFHHFNLVSYSDRDCRFENRMWERNALIFIMFYNSFIGGGNNKFGTDPNSRNNEKNVMRYERRRASY